MKPGVYTNLSSEEYHAHKESISRSAIMDFAQSPYTYWAKHLNPDRPIKETTPAMQFGTAFHMYCLEPQLFWAHYAVKTEHFTLKHLQEVHGKDKGKFLFEEQKLSVLNLSKENKAILSADEYTNLKNMLDRITLNDSVMELSRGGKIENSFFWQDENSGLLLKARPDILHDNMIVDLKTCADASPRAFQSSMVTGGYHIQGAMIRDAVEAIEGHRINNVINICIETKYPYNMAIYIIDEFAIDAGQEKYKQICLDLNEAKETNTFADYGIMTIGLPKWAS